MTLTIEPEDSEGTILGKAVSALQTGITVGRQGIYGTLHYVTGYTEFSGDEAEQSGYYLALKAETEDENDVITVELINGTVGHPVTLDSDRNVVLRISNKDIQKVQFVMTHTNEDTTTTTETVTYKLDDLKLVNS